MFAIIRSEWLKLRKSKIMPVIIAGPAIGFLTGLTIEIFNGPIKMNEWYLTIVTMNLTYSLLFLPLITGVLAGLICRYEHQAGGWKQLLALPVTRGSVFLAKYALLMLVVMGIQLLYLCAVLAVGTVKGYTDPFPLAIVWKSILGGWVATFPLIALQLSMSIMWKSFAAPFAVNVVFVLPSILVVNSARFGPYYPWAQPFMMMNIGGKMNGFFNVPWEQVLTIVGGSFVLFYAIGFLYFQRKSI